ncbi:hypothetical protein ZWY2020_030245 [Hordeum vulgare]|nr:hypothetical protein ZWY2020_030245 [Hordeum vulgare]
MSSFFGYDPYDYYYPAYGGYDAAADAYFQDGERMYRHARRRAPAWNDYASYFPGVHATEPAARKATLPRPSPLACRPDSFEIEVTGPDPDPPKLVLPKKPTPSAEEAAVRVQAAARGHMARRMVREVRAVEQEADAVAARVASEADALRADAMKRVGLGRSSCACCCASTGCAAHGSTAEGSPSGCSRSRTPSARSGPRLRPR